MFNRKSSGTSTFLEGLHMKSNVLKIGTAALFVAVGLAMGGCCSKPECVKTVQAPPPPPAPAPTNPCGPATAELPALPPNAKAGECYAKVYVPATYRSVTERVLVREASDRVETVPAEYEWVEERVMTKEASTELVATPAEMGERERTIEVTPARTDWEVKTGTCDVPGNQPTKDVFCLVNHPPESRTIRESYVAKPAAVQEKVIPAEYGTVKRQRLVHAATTRRVTIPAEYAEVTRTVKVCDARIAWQRVACEVPKAMSMEEPAKDAQPLSMNTDSGDTINAVKGALRTRGYTPGPNNGEIRARDLVAINKFQKDNHIAIGDLNDETMQALRITSR